MNKKTLIRILTGLIAITVIGTGAAYFIYKPEKPGFAFYIACLGGVLVFNFILSLFLIIMNFKK